MHAAKHDSAFKKSEFLIYSKICINLESIMLSEISYKQRNILYDFPYVR